MSLLSCARKHRSLLWYRYQHQHYHQRAMARRHALAAANKTTKQQTKGTPLLALTATGSSSAALCAALPLLSPVQQPAAAISTVAASPRSSASSAAAASLSPSDAHAIVPVPPLTTVASLPTRAASTDASSTINTKERSSNSSNTNNTEQQPTPPQPSQPQPPSQKPPTPPPSTGTWRTMLVTLVAMFNPEWLHEQQPVASETDAQDDVLRVQSVPPRISDVVTSKDSDLFWRYDMDSYAANRHNEDRSQSIQDSFVDPTTGAATSVFFCACYDGHGGEQAVEFVQRHLYANIRARLVAHTESPKLAIINGFRDTDDAFHAASRHKFQHGEWSACSVVALVVGKTLYVASCGDCRAIMAVRDPTGTLRVEQITSDHSANELTEQRRLRVAHPDDCDIVREIGARNFYVKGRLQPTRSLGDTYMKVKDVNRAPMPRGLRIHGSFKRPYITAVPDVFEIDVANRQPEFLVLGSDGLYGEMSNQEIVHHVAMFRDAGEANVSAALRGAVLERVSHYYGFTAADMEDIVPGDRRNYHDDITIDVLHFAPPSPPLGASFALPPQQSQQLATPHTAAA